MLPRSLEGKLKCHPVIGLMKYYFFHLPCQGFIVSYKCVLWELFHKRQVIYTCGLGIYTCWLGISHEPLLRRNEIPTFSWNCWKGWNLWQIYHPLLRFMFSPMQIEPCTMDVSDSEIWSNVTWYLCIFVWFELNIYSTETFDGWTICNMQSMAVLLYIYHYSCGDSYDL